MLRNLAAEPGQADTEIVHAKYVVGADGEDPVRLLLVDYPDTEGGLSGAHSWVRKSFNIVMDGEQTSTFPDSLTLRVF